MNAHRRTARLAGIFYLITFITAIPALLLYDPVLNDAGGSARDRLGGVLGVYLIVKGFRPSSAG
jgi:hypothetical protein